MAVSRISNSSVFFLLLCLVVAVVSVPPFWGERGHDAQHSRYAQASGRNALWAGAYARTKTKSVAFGEPVVDAQGVAYFVVDNSLTAVNLTSGSNVWQKEVSLVPGATSYFPQLVLDAAQPVLYGTAYGADKSGFIFSANTQQGALNWATNFTSNYSHSVLAFHAEHNFVLLGNGGDSLRAVNPSTGANIWTVTPPAASGYLYALLVSPDATGNVIALWGSQWESKNTKEAVQYTLQALQPTDGAVAWTYDFKGFLAALDLVTSSNIFVSVGEGAGRSTWAFSTANGGVPVAMPFVRLLAQAADDSFIAVIHNQKRQAAVGRVTLIMQGNATYTATWEQRWNDVSESDYWNTTKAVVDGDDMVYLMLSDNIYGLYAKQGNSSWTYETESKMTSHSSMSLGVANGQSVLFVPQSKDSYAMLGCCHEKGVCTANLTCECAMHYYGNSCQFYCLAEDTCSGHGICESDGNCTCDSTEFWEFTTYGGDNCKGIVNLTLIAGIFVALSFLAVIVFTVWTIIRERRRSNKDYAPLGSVVG